MGRRPARAQVGCRQVNNVNALLLANLASAHNLFSCRPTSSLSTHAPGAVVQALGPLPRLRQAQAGPAGTPPAAGMNPSRPARTRL